MNVRGTSTLVDVLLGITVITLLVFVAVASLAAAYPVAARRMATGAMAGNPSLIASAARIRNLSDRLLHRAADGYAYRIEEPWRKLVKRNPTTSRLSTTIEREQCLSCHEGFWERARFSVVYNSHPVHAAQGIPCARCHQAEGPERDCCPPMDRCTECHEQTALSEDCGHCHPPGSVFHGARSAAAPAAGQQCDVCHPQGSTAALARSHDMPQMEDTECGGCHAEAFCSACHPPSHPSGYESLHPQEMRARTKNITECWNCHPATWCGTTCHSSSTSRLLGSRHVAGAAL